MILIPRDRTFPEVTGPGAGNASGCMPLTPTPPTMKEGVIGNTRFMHKDVPQNECTFLCEKAQRRRRQRLSGAQK